MHKLVSIITPCYNGERYLDRYFQSLLNQTYPAIEVIFINDGSTDDTERIALEYGKKLEERGFRFIYFSQANAGQSAAINQGLKAFSGDYLNWTDADDYLTDDSVEKRVDFLESHPATGLVIGRSAKVEDTEFKQVGIVQETSLSRTKVKELAEDFLKGVISCTCCCSTMVRASMFRDSMPEPLQIETPREIGQNYQLFLPIMFKYPVAYVPDILGYYVIHSDSHSHSIKTYEQKLHIQDVVTETLKSIADRINTNEETRFWFRNKIEEYDCRNRLEFLQHHRKKDGLQDIISRMKDLGVYDSSARKIVLKIRYSFLKRLGDRIWRLRNR